MSTARTASTLARSMRLVATSLAAWALIAAVSLGASDDPDVSFQNGQVTVIATDVSVALILEEWSEKGDTRFVDLDTLSRVPVRLEMVDVTEVYALRVLLGDSTGYVAVRRAIQSEGRSRFDRVLLVASSNPRQAGLSPITRGGAPHRPTSPREAVTVGALMTGVDVNVGEDDAPGGIAPQPTLWFPAGTLPVTAPRPGMPVGATDDQRPVFIR